MQKRFLAFFAATNSLSSLSFCSFLRIVTNAGKEEKNFFRRGRRLQLRVIGKVLRLFNRSATNTGKTPALLGCPKRIALKPLLGSRNTSCVKKSLLEHINTAHKNLRLHTPQNNRLKRPHTKRNAKTSKTNTAATNTNQRKNKAIMKQHVSTTTNAAPPQPEKNSHTVKHTAQFGLAKSETRTSHGYHIIPQLYHKIQTTKGNNGKKPKTYLKLILNTSPTTNQPQIKPTRTTTTKKNTKQVKDNISSTNHDASNMTNNNKTPSHKYTRATNKLKSANTIHIHQATPQSQQTTKLTHLHKTAKQQQTPIRNSPPSLNKPATSTIKNQQIQKTENKIYTANNTRPAPYNTTDMEGQSAPDDLIEVEDTSFLYGQEEEEQPDVTTSPPNRRRKRNGIKFPPTSHYAFRTKKLNKQHLSKKHTTQKCNKSNKQSTNTTTTHTQQPNHFILTFTINIQDNSAQSFHSAPSSPATLNFYGSANDNSQVAANMWNTPTNTAAYRQQQLRFQPISSKGKEKEKEKEPDLEAINAQLADIPEANYGFIRISDLEPHHTKCKQQ